MTTYIAIGDIHGRADLLDKMITKITDYIDKNKPERKFELVFLGDYIDRGHGSKQVIDRLIGLEDEIGVPCTFLLGNHEKMCLTSKQHPYFWLENGGFATQKSYPNGKVSEEHLAWMRNLSLYYETDMYIFVHAGLAPRPFVEQINDDETLIWIRDKFLNSDYDWGRLVIHGHTPRKTPDVKPNRINIDTGAVFYGTLTAVVLKPTGHEFIQVKESPFD